MESGAGRWHERITIGSGSCGAFAVDSFGELIPWTGSQCEISDGGDAGCGARVGSDVLVLVLVVDLEWLTIRGVLRSQDTDSRAR